MKKKLIVIAFLVATNIFCYADSWIQKADHGGNGIVAAAVGFSINGKGYVGTGSGTNFFLKELWQFDPISDAWTQKADFGGKGREAAAGFSIGKRDT
ncbi:MAG: hypothetical protein LH473_11815 [Chitinophagales bacterium]|nr:hypothetical protein [Chitinophagales bacterium]